MPNGRIHSTATATAAVITTPVVAVVFGWPALLWAAGMVTALVITPDLDVDLGSISHSHIRRRFGRVVAQVWFWYWLPYAKIASHRGYSHYPILGTLGRLAYFLPLNPLLWWIAGLPMDVWATVAAAIAAADTIHWALDALD